MSPLSELTAMEAYLDIETTGFLGCNNYITVIGIALDIHGEVKTFQLFEDNLTKVNLLKTLKGVRLIYTYNGSAFDLPFIKNCLGIDLTHYHLHRDLMYDCWSCNLKGGLKVVEKKLGINRKLKDMNGYDAVMLWERYKNNNDREALKVLLEYNKEDVVNLKALKEKLKISKSGISNTI